MSDVLPKTGRQHFGPEPGYIEACIEQLDILIGSLKDDHLREHAEIGRDALRAAPRAATEPGLDIERLALAEWTTDQGNWFLEMEDARAWATEVAREYALLSAGDKAEAPRSTTIVDDPTPWPTVDGRELTPDEVEERR